MTERQSALCYKGSAVVKMARTILQASDVKRPCEMAGQGEDGAIVAFKAPQPSDDPCYTSLNESRRRCACHHRAARNRRGYTAKSCALIVRAAAVVELLNRMPPDCPRSSSTGGHGNTVAGDWY
jgi:hypothetical protein